VGFCCRYAVHYGHGGLTNIETERPHLTPGGRPDFRPLSGKTTQDRVIDLLLIGMIRTSLPMREPHAEQLTALTDPCPERPHADIGSEHTFRWLSERGEHLTLTLADGVPRRSQRRELKSGQH
jgi:hypothetical protein